MTAPMDEPTRARIVRLYNSGVPSSHIARRLGVSRRDVNRAIRKEAKTINAKENER